jgi:hypothetical protein
MNRKYTFAIFENCSNKFFGMKVIAVYFDVHIALVVMRESLLFS